MSKFVEDKKRYILTRSGLDDREDVASVDLYSGNIYWNGRLDDATKFDTVEEAKELMGIQENIAKLFKKDWKFEVLEEHKIVGKVNE